MQDDLLHILQHSLGVDKYGRGRQYRNHFATGPGSTDYPICEKLCEMGLMQDLGTRKIWGHLHCFIVTKKGIDAVALESPSPPKLTRSQKRYQEYLKIGDCFDSFHHYLRYTESKRKESAIL